MNTHFYMVVMASDNGFSRKNVHLFLGFFWVRLSTLFHTLFRFISRVFVRWFSFDSSPIIPKALAKELDCVSFGARDSEKAGCDEEEEEKENFVFKFRFQTYEEFIRSNVEKCDYVKPDSDLDPPVSKMYDFMSRKSFSVFMKKSENSNLNIKELDSHSHDGSLGDKEIPNHVSESEAGCEEKFRENSKEFECRNAEKDFKLEKEPYYSRKEQFEKHENSVYEDEFPSEKDFIVSDSDTFSISSSDEFSLMSRLIGSGTSSDGFLSEKDFDIASELDTLKDIIRENALLEDLNLNTMKVQHEHYEEEGDDTVEESKKQDENNWCEDEEFDGLESLWEHQDLMEQLKMELQKVRAIGVKNILEQSKSPKVTVDLKPLKIDENFKHGNLMEDQDKEFCKRYREGMRKFDILIYQKMYALGSLQLRDPLETFSIARKSSKNPAITSLLGESLGLGRNKKSEEDPKKKLVRELHSDLETAYVGQLCLSWEFIQWQYDKALELCKKSKPYGVCLYNEVAGEFQQFQVLLQRFNENEPFEGPRVENYVKKRCVASNLLQVPIIRGDRLRDKSKETSESDDAITSDMLVEIMQESIQIISNFIQSDKNANTLILKSKTEPRLELQDPSDSELLMEVQVDLQKKEKKLRDITRSGKSCIWKKLQKISKEEDDDDDDEGIHYLFCQVDMKLVTRALNMASITTEQLVWCWNKLRRINFVNRKIVLRKTSFFLFPS